MSSNQGVFLIRFASNKPILMLYITIFYNAHQNFKQLLHKNVINSLINYQHIVNNIFYDYEIDSKCRMKLIISNSIKIPQHQVKLLILQGQY